MKIKILKRMMIDRTIAQKNEVLTVTVKAGKELIDKGHAVEVESPKSTPSKTETTKKADSKAKDDKAD
ncbi:hypothetical protein R0I52_06395 [Psychrobacter sp. CAM01]|uniref:hypothetical protein n=1 Tax=Psychrobacter sp. CAM01 TaxID=3080335 RepID=UPI00293638F3|nr:hypothetical protein [Psychrobacter sp. CAM01]MDV2860337.1 hypothetical protein [Psychrobacter sp. CAM01]